jgi:peptide/nickel transport system substrate-binding protein
MREQGYPHFQGRGHLSRRQFLRVGTRAGLGLAAGAMSGAVPWPQQVWAQQTSDASRAGGVLTMWIGGDPPNFDVHQNSTYLTQHITAPCYNNLVQYDPLDPKRIVPDLAERWEVSPDGRRYTFYLVKGVRFHDGKPFSSADVKVSLDRMRQPPSGVISIRREAFAAVDDVQTPDASTVVVLLKQPNPSLPAQLAGGHMSIYPKHVLEAQGDMKKVIVGTGPFKLKKYTRGVSVELERNPDYFVQGRPYLEGITLYIMPDPNSAYAAFRTGRLLLLRFLELGLGKRAEQELGHQITLQRTRGLGFFAFNMNTKRKPWDDPRVREAASLAIDRRTSITAVSEGEGELGGFLPPSSLLALPTEELTAIPGYGTDLEANRARARQLLTEAGFPDGFKTTMLTRKLPLSEKLSVYVKDQLAKIGIQATLDVQESAAAFDILNRRGFDTAPWWTAFAVDDPEAVFSEFYTCEAARNYASLCLPEVDQLFQQQSQALDPEQRKRLVHEMERTLLQSHGSSVLHWHNYLTGHWPQVRNWVQPPSLYNNQRLQDVWLAKA